MYDLLADDQLTGKKDSKLDRLMHICIAIYMHDSHIYSVEDEIKWKGNTIHRLHGFLDSDFNGLVHLSIFSTIWKFQIQI